MRWYHVDVSKLLLVIACGILFLIIAFNPTFGGVP